MYQRCFKGVSGVSKVLLMYQKCILRDPEVLYLHLMYQRCLRSVSDVPEVFVKCSEMLWSCYSCVIH